MYFYFQSPPTLDLIPLKAKRNPIEFFFTYRQQKTVNSFENYYFPILSSHPFTNNSLRLLIRIQRTFTMFNPSLILSLLGTSLAIRTTYSQIIELRTPEFDFEQEITNLNITRLSTLPKATFYTYNYSIVQAPPFPGSTVNPPAEPLERTAAVSLQYDYTCRTTGSSPFTYDVLQAITELNKVIGDEPGNLQCCQTRLFGNRCTRMVEWGSASLAICGRYYACLSCDKVMELLLSVVDSCRWQGRVAGLFSLDAASAKVVVHHS